MDMERVVVATGGASGIGITGQEINVNGGSWM